MRGKPVSGSGTPARPFIRAYRSKTLTVEPHSPAFEYVVDLPCEPKLRLGGSTGVWTRLRHLEPLQEGAPPASDEAKARALEAGFELRPLAFHCTRCPANHARRVFGCFERVHCPISGDAEAWLMDLLPRGLSGREPAPEQAVQAGAVRELMLKLDLLGIIGARLDSRRQTALFQRRRSMHRAWGGGLRRARLTSSQLLELLLFSEPVTARFSELVCRALGLWQDAETGEDGVPEVYFTQPPETTDDPSVEELKRFFHALMIAASLEVTVTVWPPIRLDP